MPRPAPKIVLESAWQSQQQRQETSESASTSTRKLVQREREEQGNPTDNPELTCRQETDAKYWVTCWESRACNLKSTLEL